MEASDDLSPVVQRRRLRTELRKARQDAGQTQGEVAAAMDWSLSKIIRIEAGIVGISTNDLKALLRHYKIVDPDHVNELIALGRAARERAWWSQYRDVATSGLLQLIGYESAAAVRRNFEPLLVPGLLQTEEYARAVIPVLDERVPQERVDTLVEIRMRRQELMERTNPPELFFILDEAAIRRVVGSRAIMRRQLRSLVELAEKPNVTIEVVPFTAGIHQGMRGSFVVLEFPNAADDDVLYVEDASGGLLNRTDPEEILAFSEVFERLRNVSLGAKDSSTYIDKLADEMNLPECPVAEISFCSLD
jgi:transcriptional regulator with XRE-family HTH domain